MAMAQASTNRSKDSAVQSEELQRKLFLERMERKLAFKEAMYNKLYRRMRPNKKRAANDASTADFLGFPSE